MSNWWFGCGLWMIAGITCAIGIELKKTHYWWSFCVGINWVLLFLLFH